MKRLGLEKKRKRGILESLLFKIKKGAKMVV